MSSTGQRSLSPNTKTQEPLTVTRICTPLRSTEATNTNAREHNQPDRLKLLFREQRGYRTLSEQKVTEWLSKNKQFYAIMPKDLTEIPEQIFSPLESTENECPNEGTPSNVRKSDHSGHNATLNGNLHGSTEGYPTSKHRDKMNHYLQKSHATRPVNYGSVVLAKSEYLQLKQNKLSSTANKEIRRIRESDANRIDRSTTAADSLSTRTMNRELDPVTTKRTKHSNSRRDSHSLVQRSATIKRHGEPWPLNGVLVAARRALPGILQNNACVRQRIKLADSCLEPVRSLQQTLSWKKTLNIRKQGPSSVPKRRREQHRFELMPIGKEYSVHEARSHVMKCHRSTSQTVIRNSPSLMRRTRKIATICNSNTEEKSLAHHFA
ncbi:uncharacterized protein DEA37_0008724 [Paragonimus westermani]|uniref:Uncharacterized protein n=1 Tax=Paragonimus westermani TaxID=34504 RepID=A0A5J4NBX9_9TREM|nr:uncharacterized protein DEA37_0008724 [Paragonimus westermani]